MPGGVDGVYLASTEKMPDPGADSLASRDAFERGLDSDDAATSPAMLYAYAAIQAGTMLDPILQPGDRVVVGTDSLAQVWRDVLGALPAFALFQNIGI